MAELEKWTENVIVVDADYVDSVAFDLIVNFERMLQRRIPNADMPQWLDCIALDGGMRTKDDGVNTAETSVIFIHSKEKSILTNFTPGNLSDELNGKAFRDSLGEFQISCYPVEEVVSANDFLLDVVKTAVNHKDVHRIMVVSNCDDGEMPTKYRQALRDVDDDKRVTIFAMAPIAGGNYRQEILGYSLMNALGIKAEELSVKG